MPLVVESCSFVKHAVKDGNCQEAVLSLIHRIPATTLQPFVPFAIIRWSRLVVEMDTMGMAIMCVQNAFRILRRSMVGVVQVNFAASIAPIRHVPCPEQHRVVIHRLLLVLFVIHLGDRLLNLLPVMVRSICVRIHEALSCRATPTPMVIVAPTRFGYRKNVKVVLF